MHALPTFCAAALITFACPTSAQSDAATDSKPTSRAVRYETPEAVVEAYVAAAKVSDEARMADTYIAPFDAMGRITAKFRSTQRLLLAKARELFGDEGVAVVDEPRLRSPDPAVLERHEVLSKTEEKDLTRLKVRLFVAKVEKPVETEIEVRFYEKSWRISGFGGRPIGLVDGHDKYILEWEVAEEAARKTLDALSAGKIKKAGDIAVMRNELMKTITHDRMMIRKLIEGPSSQPTSQPVH